MGVADARKAFREGFLPEISKGKDPEGPRERKDRRGVTVRDLFVGYTQALKARKAATWRNVERVLLGADLKSGVAKEIGDTKRAADVTPQDVREALADIYDRGVIVMAAQTRAYLSAAFAFGLASANSYTGAASRVNWGLKFNPVTAIPADPEAKRAGERHLAPWELRTFWRWLEANAGRSRGTVVLRLEACTGQRLTEITVLNEASYDAAEKMLDWSKTKNGLPHAIPLPAQAVRLLDKLEPNSHGLYFPNGRRPNQPMGDKMPERLIYAFRAEHNAKEGARVIAPFTPRDLRRTWKTLAGAAGLSKEIRDRIQNHARSDVSSRHYDRYSYLAEKRAAMKTWEVYLERILSGELDNPVSRLNEERV
jgi:integrase